MSAPNPGTAAWTRLVSSSKVAAILGVSPWQSPYALWMEMSGRVAREHRDSDAIRRGNYLEAGVVQWWLDQHPEYTWSDSQQTMRLDDWGIATLDVLARTNIGSDDAVVAEIKTTSHWDEWGEPGTDEVPAHYYSQVLWQLACTPQAERAYVAVLGPFLDFREYVVERDQSLIDGVVRTARAFYDSLDGDVPPELDDHPATLATLRRQHPEIASGETAVIDTDLAAEYVTADLDQKAATDRLRAAQARILNAAREAQYIATDSGLRVARRQAGGRGVSLRRVAKTAPVKEPAA